MVKMAVQFWRQGVGLINNPQRNINHARQVIIAGFELRVANRAIPAFHAGVHRYWCIHVGRKGNPGVLKRRKGRHRCARAAPTIGAVAIGDDRRTDFRRKGRMATITSAGDLADELRRQPGVPRSLRGCSGAAGFQSPFSTSGSKMGSQRRRLACADKRRRVRTRET